MLERCAARLAPKRKLTIDPLAEELLVSYNWPGNIRELRNVVESAFILAEGDTITIADLPNEIGGAPRGGAGEGPNSVRAIGDLHHQVRAFEANLLTQALQEADGDRRVAAQRLGIGVSTLYRKLERYASGPSNP